MEVKCFGGPLSGTAQRFGPTGRLSHRTVLNPLKGGATSIVTYSVRRYWERYRSPGGKYRVYRQVGVAVADGVDLLPHEDVEIQREIVRQPWVWHTVPSILYDFENWWRWQLSKRPPFNEWTKMARIYGPWWDL